MNIQQYIPNYPLLNSQDVFDSFDAENFTSKIFHKKEFYDLKLEKNMKQNPDGLLDHQKVIARFLSPHTIYDELFLNHQAGSGKTCAAIATIEANLDSSRFNKALIILKNKELIDKFIAEISYKCTNNKYIPVLEPDPTLSQEQFEQKKKRKIRKKIFQKYSLYTYETFYSNFLESMTMPQLRKRFSNTVIVLDEIQNITIKQYDKYHEFLHNLDNRKILIMTATAMRNDAFEIVPIMNLILPLELQFPIDPKEFYSTLFNNRKEISENGKKYLENRLRGRVSYLETRIDIQKQFIGNVIPPLKFTKVVPSSMSNFQSENYQFIYESEQKQSDAETTSSGFYLQSQEAALFIFPDGSVGNAGFDKYVKYSALTKKYSFVDDLKREFAKANNKEQKLKLIAKFSTKYAETIRNILDNRNKNTFVFCTSIKGSGAIVFGLCLGLFGYSMVTNSKQVSGNSAKYTILSSETSTDISKIISAFNSKHNNRGQKLQVIIGGMKISEGFTFRNIQNIHVLTPHWNFAIIDQTLARGIRAFAHRDLPEKPMVDIYLHVAMNNIPNLRNIDLYMYKTAEDKDYIIKQIEYQLKINAFDCPITYERNLHSNAEEFSRDCQFNSCRYRCNGINIYPYQLRPDQLDYTTYDLYYHSPKTREQLTERLVQMFQKVYQLTFEQIEYILKYENQIVFTSSELYSTLENIEMKNIVLYDHFGFKCFLKSEDNVYYLAQEITSNSKSDVYYLENPRLMKKMDMETFIEQLSQQNIQQKISYIAGLELKEQVEEIDKLEPEIKNIYIEQAFINSQVNENLNPLTKEILTMYKNYIYQTDKHFFNTFVDPPKILFNNNWVEVEPDELDMLEEHIMQSKNTKLFGKIVNGVFSIIDKRNNPKNKGKVCTSFSLKELQEIYQFVENKQISEKLNKTGLCKKIQKSFKENNLMLN